MTRSSKHICAICGEAEPLGLDICVNCGGAPDDSGDALVFLEPPGSDRNRNETITMLRRLVGPERMPEPDGNLLGAGHRALLRVRHETASRVVDSLEAGGVSAVIRNSATVTSLPRSFYWLLAATMGVGMWTGISVEPLYLLTTPVMTVGLWIAAQLRMRRPAIRSAARLRLFPRPVEREILDAFAKLPPGNAQDLLARLVRATEHLFVAPGESLQHLTRADLAELVSSSCHAARDLGDVEKSIRDLRSPREVMDAERLQMKMEGKFRDAIAVMKRMG